MRSRRVVIQVKCGGWIDRIRAAAGRPASASPSLPPSSSSAYFSFLFSFLFFAEVGAAVRYCTVRVLPQEPE